MALRIRGGDRQVGGDGPIGENFPGLNTTVKRRKGITIAYI